MDKTPQIHPLRDFREKTLQLTQLQFAALVGMGVATINRYENGADPTPAHAQLLSGLMEDANTLLRMLADKEEVLGRPTHMRLTKIAEGRLAYSALLRVEQHQRSIASPEYTGKREFDLERLVQMILCFTHLGEWKTKLNKLLFYSDFLAFKELGRSISGTRYVRGSYGPIPDQFQQLFAALMESEILTAREEFLPDDRPVEKLVAKRVFDRTKFSKSELEILEFVYNFFKNKTAKHAVGLSHEESAYIEAGEGESLSYSFASSLKLKFEPTKSTKPKQSLADLAKEITTKIPAKELHKLPKDAALNLDHYLYGAPKKK